MLNEMIVYDKLAFSIYSLVVYKNKKKYERKTKKLRHLLSQSITTIFSNN